MPIKGLTERMRLPRLGKIHLGVKVKNQQGVEYPQAVDYFVCPPEVQAVYGEQPKTLEIMFPVDDEGVFASQFYRAYSQTRGLVCRGDGDTANRLINVATRTGEEETGVVTGEVAGRDATEVEWVEGITCPASACQYYASGQCRELMTLQFLLPAVPGLGIWQLDTSSVNSIVNINSGVALVRGIFGRVSGISLTLSVEPITVAPGGRKKTVHVLRLGSTRSLAALGAAVGAPSPPVALPVPDQQTPELLYPSAEESAARTAAQAAPTEAPPPEEGVPATPDGEPTFANVGALLKTALDMWGINKTEVLRALGFSDKKALGRDLAAYYHQLQEIYGDPKVPA